MESRNEHVAYFSMEIAIDPDIPTFSGGLGVLAGDTIRSAADLGVPMVAVSLLHRKGYFYQRIGPDGWQRGEDVAWSYEDRLAAVDERVSVTIEGRPVSVRGWRYDVKGVGGHVVPVYLLDTDVDENTEWDRTLTDHLYGGDQHYRLCQEAVLGIGGYRFLQEAGYGKAVERYHMNEGHASLLALEMLDELVVSSGRSRPGPDDLEMVRRRCVFTTHTPVSAGHDQFPMDLVKRVLADREALFENEDVFCCEGALNMTYLALNLSHYVNGVAKKHGEVSRHMFADYEIDSITNGVHAATWVSDPFARLYDKHIPGWREDNFSLRYALSIPESALWSAHVEAKRDLVRYVNRETNAGFDEDDLTIGFARRMAAYKRPEMVLSSPERLMRLCASVGPIQIVFAGKAHPRDDEGKLIIQRILRVADAVGDRLRIVFLDNYDMALGALMTSGVDLWLNTPQPPMEASGTSGMKAALNGVPSLSVLDGWWIEGCIEGTTGWSIAADEAGGEATEVDHLYDQLEIIHSLFRQDRQGWISVMRHAIALNGSFFNTQRMLEQYVLKAYFC